MTETVDFYERLKEQLPEEITKEKAKELCPSYQTGNYLQLQVCMSRTKGDMISTSDFIWYLRQGDDQAKTNRDNNDAMLNAMKQGYKTNKRYGLGQSRDY